MKVHKLLMKGNSCREDIMTVVVANIMLGLFLLEQTRFPLIAWIHLAVFFIWLYLWITITLQNGIQKRYEFMLFLALFFVIPQCTIWLEQYFTVQRVYNKWLDITNQILTFVVIHPMKQIIDFLFQNYHITLMTSVNLILLVFVAVFYIGYTISGVRGIKQNEKK